MLYGVQTHFDGSIGDETCRELVARRWQLARIRGLERTTDEMLAMVAEAVVAGLVPLVSVDRYEQIEALPAGVYAEWRNEPDIQTDVYVPPAEYAGQLMGAAAVAARSPVGEIGGPVVSNLNARGTTYILQVIEACGGSLPRNVFGVTHRYGHKGILTSEFETAHKLSQWQFWGPFRTRRDEYEWFKRTIGAGRPWLVSEGGWASTEGINEDYQAELARQEFALAKACGALAYVWYQINDGPSTQRIDNFGLRRTDGTWKPVADVVPQETEDMSDPDFVLSRKDLIPHPHKGPGFYTCRYPKGSTATVLCVEPGGYKTTRPAGSHGAWETLRDDGTCAVFEEVDDAYYAYRLVD